MAEVVADYVEKAAAFEAAKRALENCLTNLRHAVALLSTEPRAVYIQVPGITNPVEITHGRQRLDASALPTAAELQRALLEEFTAGKAAMAAYERLSETERGALKTPPWAQR